MTGPEPVPALRLVPGTDDVELQASMARHPAGKHRQESLQEPRRRWWLRIGRRA